MCPPFEAAKQLYDETPNEGMVRVAERKGNQERREGWGRGKEDSGTAEEEQKRKAAEGEWGRNSGQRGLRRMAGAGEAAG